MFSDLPTDILHHIKQFLSYKERAVYLSLCSVTSLLCIEPFFPYHIVNIEWPSVWPNIHRPSYLLIYHPFELPYYYHPQTYIGKGWVSIILYDTPHTYYHIWTNRPYEPNKSIRAYLSEYDATTYYINRIKKYTDDTDDE
jgi:hypothetical protein